MKAIRAASLTAALVIILTGLNPIAIATTAPYSTTSFTPLSVGETTQGSTRGVAVNYNNTLSDSLEVFTFIDVTNSVGQTVFVQSSIEMFIPGESETVFFGLTGLPSGTYSATVFVSSLDLVPLSVASNVQVVL